MKSVALFVAYVFLSAFGLYKIKLSEVGINPDFVVGFGAYLAGFLLWFVILKTYPLSIAFPVAAGALILATQLVGFFFLGEGMTLQKESGVALILAGIVVLFVDIR